VLNVDHLSMKKESLTDSILVMQSDCGLAEVEYDKKGEAEK
jgi:hypothetical protein